MPCLHWHISSHLLWFSLSEQTERLLKVAPSFHVKRFSCLQGWLGEPGAPQKLDEHWQAPPAAGHL